MYRFINFKNYRMRHNLIQLNLISLSFLISNRGKSLKETRNLPKEHISKINLLRHGNKRKIQSDKQQNTKKEENSGLRNMKPTKNLDLCHVLL